MFDPPMLQQRGNGSIEGKSHVERNCHIPSHVELGKEERAECLIGGERNTLAAELSEDYCVKPTAVRGHNKMRIFQEEIFGPVVSVTTFMNEGEALEIDN